MSEKGSGVDTGERHLPVMVERCVDALLEACSNATVVGIDRDAEALDLATKRLARHGKRFIPHHAEFDDIPGALRLAGVARADAVLLDLGLSSLQIDETARGFAYSADAPLDMRMNRDDAVTAADLLAQEEEGEIARILREYGEERYAGRIARAVVRRRTTSPVTRSADLVDLVRAAIPAVARAEGGNPAKRTFQALRIAVNDELGILDRALPAVIDATRVGGRVAVLAYHSLEDRRVKRAFATGAEVRAPVGMPIIREEDTPYLRQITRGAERPTEEEIVRNPRSRPARLRAVERIRDTIPLRGAA
jgi:16S rRNA (cytosine1402-N4)-methyltransferase